MIKGNKDTLKEYIRDFTTKSGNRLVVDLKECNKLTSKLLLSNLMFLREHMEMGVIKLDSESRVWLHVNYEDMKYSFKTEDKEGLSTLENTDALYQLHEEGLELIFESVCLDLLEKEEGFISNSIN